MNETTTITTTTTTDQCTLINPPGNKLTSGSTITKGFRPISFKNTRDTNPLPPLVQANYDKDGSMSVSAFVFIDTEESSDLVFAVYFDGNVLKPRFYITYNSKNTSVKDFTPIRVDFNLTNVDLNNMTPKTIEVFVWDCDPVTSRGTVTTVQSGV